MDRPGRCREDETCGTVLLEMVEVKLPVPEAPDVPILKARVLPAKLYSGSLKWTGEKCDDGGDVGRGGRCREG